MKKILLVLGLLLGSVVGASLNLYEIDSLKGPISTLSREEVVKKYVVERASHVAQLNLFLKDKFLGSASCFPIKCVKYKEGFKITYLTAKHSFDGKKIDTLRLTIVSHYHRKYGIGSQPHRIHRKVKVSSLSLNDDAALVEAITEEKIPVFVLDLQNELRVLDETYVIGYPGNVSLYINKGNLSGPFCHKTEVYWKMTNNLFFGNSGGPVVSVKTGKVIGISIGMFHSRGFPLTSFSFMLPVKNISSWLSKSLK